MNEAIERIPTSIRKAIIMAAGTVLLLSVLLLALSA